MRPPNPDSPSPTLLVPRLLALGLLVSTVLAGCGPPEPEGPSLTFLRERQLWRATEVSAMIERVPSKGAPQSSAMSADGGGVEVSLQITARDGEKGEQLTFLVLLADDPEAGLLGTHPLRVFGSLSSFDPVKGYERLQGVSNACTPNDLSLTSGTLTVESHDAENRTLSGSFIANVCNVADMEKAWTLGDGRFAGLSY